jgi:hypothetical protein
LHKLKQSFPPLQPAAGHYTGRIVKRRLAILGLCLVAIFCVGMLLGLFLPRLMGVSSSSKPYNTAVLLKEVQTLSQLVTVKYVMEKVVIQEDPSEIMFRRLLWDNTRIILVAHGIVKAGVDLSKIQPGDLQINGRKVKIVLPRAQITDSYLDEQQTQVIEHNTSFLRDFNKQLESSARQNALDDIRRAARTSGILKDADERARAQLTSLFHQLGFEAEIVSK